MEVKKLEEVWGGGLFLVAGRADGERHDTYTRSTRAR